MLLSINGWTEKQRLCLNLKELYRINEMNNALLPELVLVEDTLTDETLSLRGISKSGVPCHVTVLRDGLEALNHLLNAQEPLPNLIVLDYNLPRLNGLEILTQIRHHPILCSIPVVIFSGSNTGYELKECYRVGANSCVTKPGDFAEYIDILAAVTRYWLTVNQASDYEVRTSPLRLYEKTHL